MGTKKTRRTCPEGHLFYKSSDCPVCPICEKQQHTAPGFLSSLGAPARRALEGAGITSLARLAAYREEQVLQLHGMGPRSLPFLRKALAAKGLTFKK